MAGGFSITPGKLEAFRAFMQKHIAAQADSAETSVETLIEGILSVQGVRSDFVHLIHDHIGPFGQEHPEPLFVMSNVRVVTADVVGESHIRTMISDWEGGQRIKAMAFRAVGTPLGNALLKQGKQPLHIAGFLKIDNWQGRDNVEMHIKDAAFAMPEEQSRQHLA